MTGLKSGSGDDLWGDESDEENTETDDQDAITESTDQSTPTEETEANANTENEPSKQSVDTTATSAEPPSETGSSARADGASSSGRAAEPPQPYIVRRAIQDKSVQFERDERLTFFVHDDVVDGERDLLTEVESALGRDIPKFDVREAVYRAALRNQDDVLDELLEMGYALDED